MSTILTGRIATHGVERIVTSDGLPVELRSVHYAADGHDGDRQAEGRGHWIYGPMLGLESLRVAIPMVRAQIGPEFGYRKGDLLVVPCGDCEGTGIFEGPDFRAQCVACRGRSYMVAGLEGQDF